MKHILLIHIGISKTGTSALQAFLYGNMRKLEEYGWCYPDLNQELFGLQFASFGKEINGSVFYKEPGKLDTKADNWNRAWEQILMHLKSSNVIISDERICVWDTNKFLKAAKEKYENIKVIIYLRRQDRAIESFWNQKVKNPVGCSQTFKEFIESNNGAECSHYYYKKQLDEISNIVGKENLIVRVYEKGQLCGENHTTESDFLSVIGIKADWKDWEKYPPQNLRLGTNYLEIKRIFNSLQFAENIDMGNGAMYMTHFERLSQVFCKDEIDKGYFTHEEREEFLKQYALENEQIARDYLYREDGILFYDDKMDYPLYDCTCTSFERDLMLIIFALINAQNDEFKRLEKHYAALAEKLLLCNKFINGRKFLLFGAGHKCKKLLTLLNIPITWIVDNDKKKNGKKLYGIEIVAPKEVKDWSDYFVIVTCADTDEIEKQLLNLNLKKEEDFVFAKEYFACY